MQPWEVLFEADECGRVAPPLLEEALVGSQLQEGVDGEGLVADVPVWRNTLVLRVHLDVPQFHLVFELPELVEVQFKE